MLPVYVTIPEDKYTELLDKEKELDDLKNTLRLLKFEECEKYKTLKLIQDLFK